MMTITKNIIATSSMHNHSTMCDGKNTIEQMAKAAFESGFTDFGFSGHSKALYAPYVGIGENNLADYLLQIEKVAHEYKGKMRIYKGIEQDFYAPINFRQSLDYCIGAVHDIYDKSENKYYWVDGDIETLQQCIDNMFGGNAMKMVEHFYGLTVENAKKYKPDIIAHFDLVVKNNANNALFNENSEEYKQIAKNALYKCMELDVVFEVNTGGIYRNYRQEPYPSSFLLKELCVNNAKITISADAHCTNAVAFEFYKTQQMLKQIGFKNIYVWENGNFTEKML